MIASTVAFAGIARPIGSARSISTVPSERGSAMSTCVTTVETVAIQSSVGAEGVVPE
jgi:hypothetical protein